jgi:hypothetical protein
MSHHYAKHADKPDEASDWVWGAAEIGALINRTPEQIYYLHSRGLLRGATWKVGHKLLCGSRRKLRELPALLASETSTP